MPACARISRAFGKLAGKLDRVQAERRNPATRVDQDRQRPLVGERDQVADPGVVERELLGARMQLDPARSVGQRPLGLGDRIVVRVDRQNGISSPSLVRAASSTMSLAGAYPSSSCIGNTKAPRAPASLEPGDQLRGSLTHAVGVVLTEVCVRVEQLDARGSDRATISVHGLSESDGSIT